MLNDKYLSVQKVAIHKLDTVVEGKDKKDYLNICGPVCFVILALYLEAVSVLLIRRKNEKMCHC